MKSPNPVYVASNADAIVREAVLKRELERTNNHLSATIDNNEDGSLTFFVLVLSDHAKRIEVELSRSVYIVTALDPNLVEV